MTPLEFIYNNVGFAATMVAWVWLRFEIREMTGRLDATNRRIDATIAGTAARHDATNARLEAANARLDATWQKLTEVMERTSPEREVTRRDYKGKQLRE